MPSHSQFVCRRAVCIAAEEQGVPQVVPIQLSEIEALSSVRIYIAKDLRQPDSRALGLKVTSILPTIPYPVPLH